MCILAGLTLNGKQCNQTIMVTNSDEKFLNWKQCNQTLMDKKIYEKNRSFNLEFCILENNGRKFGIKNWRTIEISRNESQYKFSTHGFFIRSTHGSI